MTNEDTDKVATIFFQQHGEGEFKVLVGSGGQSTHRGVWCVRWHDVPRGMVGKEARTDACGPPKFTHTQKLIHRDTDAHDTGRNTDSCTYAHKHTL